MIRRSRSSCNALEQLWAPKQYQETKLRYQAIQHLANVYADVSVVMASLFQRYFQASSMPKRLLQYALSRLEILETDTLDLDNLDIVWGKNSVFEFKDVGLRLKVSF